MGAVIQEIGSVQGNAVETGPKIKGSTEVNIRSQILSNELKVELLKNND